MQYQESAHSSLEDSVGSNVPFSMDDDELDGLFASHMPKLARAARRIMHNTQDSEDVLQDSLLSAFQKLHQFQGRSKFSTWLHTIIKNKAMMHLRRISVYRRHLIDHEGEEDGDSFLETAPAPGPDVEEICAERERSRILRSMLAELPATYRTVIQLCDIEGLSGEDASLKLGVSKSSLKTCLHRARRRVFQKIQRSYGNEIPRSFGKGKASLFAME